MWVPSSGRAARWCSGSQNLAPCSLWPWERLCTHGHPTSDPGHGALGERAQQRGPPQHFGCDGLPVISPHSPHQGSRVLGSGLAVACSKHRGRNKICPASPSPSSSCQGLWEVAAPSVPLPCATKHRVGDRDIIPAELLATSVCHHHPTLPTKGLLWFWLPLKTTGRNTPPPTRGSSGWFSAFSALSAPNVLSPKVGTCRDVPL